MKNFSVKVLVITEVFYPEEFLINDLVKEWQKQGLAIEVLTKTPSYPYGKTFAGYKNKLYQVNIEHGIKVHRVKIIEGYERSVFKKVTNYMVNAFIASIVALNIGRKFQGIFIYQTGPLTFALPGVLVHKFYKKKTVIWTQDLWPDTVFSYGFKESRVNRKLLNSFVRFVYNHMDTVLVTSHGFIESLKITLKKQKNFFYIPQWPLVNFSEKNSALPGAWEPGKLNFTFTGNVGKVQNLDNVIEGFALLSGMLPGKCRFNIIGDGSHLVNLKKKVEEKDIQDIVFYGRKPLSAMNSFYKASDVLVISLSDNPAFSKYLPAKFQSYLTVGKPILAVMSGEVTKLVKEFDIGWVVDPGDIKQIADKIKEIYLCDRKEFNIKGNHAKKLLNTQFNREILINKITSKVFAGQFNKETTE